MRKLYMFLLFLLLSFPSFAQQSRHFTFHYAFSVRTIQSGQKVEIWFPLAHSDPFQNVKIVSVKGDLPLKKTREAKYGNTLFHAIEPKAAKDEYNFDVEYDVVRFERFGLPREGVRPHLVKASTAETQEFLGPDRLVPVTGKLADIAAKQVDGQTGSIDQARALYDYVFNTMRYDKSGTGWGRGDAEWACDSKRGNCTDFHSVFISMARSQHIPARFEIGFPLPANKNAGEIPGYHCWAEFYDSQYGWVPVDISEAWKDKTKKDYFFGAHDVNRVQFSMGRDLVLKPAQADEPLNYFVYPYVEVGGKRWDNVSNHFSFSDAVLSASAAGSK
jgi:transglutaminase-like putative cysteine protease